jgi:hypothetical protein
MVTEAIPGHNIPQLCEARGDRSPTRDHGHGDDPRSQHPMALRGMRRSMSENNIPLLLKVRGPEHRPLAIHFRLSITTGFGGQAKSIFDVGPATASRAPTSLTDIPLLLEGGED